MTDDIVEFSPEEINNEEWRPVNLFAGFEDFYEVSSLGRVKRIAAGSGTYIGRILKPRTGKWGYKYVVLTNGEERKTAKVHRLVSFAFLGIPPEGKEAAHCDGIKSNCRANNDRKLHGTHWIAEAHPRTTLTNEDVIKIRSMIKQGIEQKYIAKIFNVAPHVIYQIKSRKNWSSI